MKFLKNKLKILLCIFLSISLLFSYIPSFSSPSVFLAPPGGIHDNLPRLAGNISPAERIHRNASKKYFGTPSIAQIRGYISRVQQLLFRLVNESGIDDDDEGMVSAVISGVILQIHFGLEIWRKTYYSYKRPVIGLIYCEIPAPEYDPGASNYAMVLRILYGSDTKYWMVPSAYEDDSRYENKIPVMQNKNAKKQFGITRYTKYDIVCLDGLFSQEDEDIIRKILEEILWISISKDLKVAELMYENNDVLERTLKTTKRQSLRRSLAVSSL